MFASSSLVSPPQATRISIPISRARVPLGRVQQQKLLPRTLRAAAVEGGGGSEPDIIADSAPPPSPSPPSSQPQQQKTQQQQRRSADSTDPIASALTRRFGIFGGLGWAAILAGGVLSEQIKTRIEDAREAKETVEVESGSALAAERDAGRGVRVRDVRLGGGATVEKGLLLVLNVRARTIAGSEGGGSGGSGSEGGGGSGSSSSLSSSSSSSSSYFIDTSAPGAKPLVLLFGTKLSGGICPGAELALIGMRAGGRRVVVVPPAAGFGKNGYTARPTEHVPEKRGEVPPGATLEYDIEVVRVSVPPS